MTVSARFLVATLGLLLLTVFVSERPTEAASQILLSWKAERSFVPSDYPGKALPSPLSPVKVRVGLVNDGRRVDLSSYTIRWFLDQYAVTQGVGVSEFVISPSLQANKDAYEVRVEILDFDPAGSIAKSILIPIVRPQVSVSGGLAGDLLSSGLNFLQAEPYFFGVNRIQDLQYAWTLNNSFVGEDSSGQFNLTVSDDYSRGDRLEIGVRVNSPENEFDRASSKVLYTIR